MKYTVNPKVFSRYPGFMRAVAIADGIDNTAEKNELAAELRATEKQVRESLGDDFKDHPRLAPWGEAFRGMGINPNKYPPSVANLVKRIRSGKELPYINSLVTISNCVSLRNLCPCGGDDLSAVKGDLLLTFAEGRENYIPLGQPDVLEHPPAGEVIYMDSETKDVFCRAWCWKNGNSSKLETSTVRAAINIDIMPPLGLDDAKRIAEELAYMLKKYTGATVKIHFLMSETPAFSII